MIFVCNKQAGKVCNKQAGKNQFESENDMSATNSKSSDKTTVQRAGRETDVPVPPGALARKEFDDFIRSDKTLNNVYGRIILIVIASTLQYTPKGKSGDTSETLNYEYESWLSKSAVSDMTCISPNTVKAYVDALVEDGYLLTGNTYRKNYKPVQGYFLGKGSATNKLLTRPVRGGGHNASNLNPANRRTQPAPEPKRKRPEMGSLQASVNPNLNASLQPHLTVTE